MGIGICTWQSWGDIQMLGLESCDRCSWRLLALALTVVTHVLEIPRYAASIPGSNRRGDGISLMAEGRLWAALEGTVCRRFMGVRLEQRAHDGRTMVAQCGSLVLWRNALMR